MSQTPPEQAPTHPTERTGGLAGSPIRFNLAAVHETVEAACPDRLCVIQGDTRLTYREVGDRSRRLANLLISSGLGHVRPRSELNDHTSGQDHLAILLYNSSEYIESMLGAFKARVVPFNVNYRYTSEELRYLLDDSQARAIAFHSEFAPIIERIAADLPSLELLLQVPDPSDNPLAKGAIWYHDAIADQPASLENELRESWSGDDLYMLYTGGTTGSPKGVLWAQSEVFAAAMGGRRLDTGQPWETYEEIAKHAAFGGTRVFPASPLMHGAAHWLAFVALTNANTIVLASDPRTFDPVPVLDTVESEDVNVLLIVGDSFGRPIVEELEANHRYLDSLLVVVSGGAMLSSSIKQRMVEALPSIMVLDGLGASETGTQASQLTAPGQVATSGHFVPTAGACIVSADRTRLLEPDESELGWLAQSGHIPLGYLNDGERTSERFITIDGQRCALTGDRASFDSEGRIDLKGRESNVINTGGEKVFAEEVEMAITSHPDVRDCVVAGVASRRWGEQVTAIIEMDPGSATSDDELIEWASISLARFKLPKSVIRVDHMVRSPAGKPDYSWARSVASGAAPRGT